MSDSTDPGLTAESFDFFADVPETIPVSFSIGVHLGPDGRAKRVTHHMRVVTGHKLKTFADRVAHAGVGKKGAKRDAAGQEAVFDIWAELVTGVEGYGAVDEYDHERVVRFFGGNDFPDGVDEATKAKVRDAMKLHVSQAVSVYYDHWSSEPSFRASGA